MRSFQALLILSTICLLSCTDEDRPITESQTTKPELKEAAVQAPPAPVAPTEPIPETPCDPAPPVPEVAKPEPHQTASFCQAFYYDYNTNGITDQGDEVHLMFTSEVNFSQSQVSDFALTSSDNSITQSFGTGAMIKSLQPSSELVIVLGTSPSAIPYRNDRFIHSKVSIVHSSLIIDVLDNQPIVNNSTGVTLLQNYDHIPFVRSTILSGKITQIVTADFNQDGFKDIFFTVNGLANVCLLGQPDGSFLKQVTTESLGGSRSLSCTVANVNRDVYPDVIVGNGYEANRVVLGGPNGLYESNQTLTYALTYAIKAFDIDNDGDDDLLEGIDGHLMFRLNENGTYSPANSVSYQMFIGPNDQHNYVQMYPQEIEITDLDGNGFKDVIVANYSTYSRVFMNHGGNLTERFAPIKIQNGLFQHLEISKVAKTFDANGDGAPDLLIHDNVFLKLYLNDGTGYFLPTPMDFGESVLTTITDVEAVDWDGDGDFEIIVGHHGQVLTGVSSMGFPLTEEATSTIYFNNGSGEFNDSNRRFLCSNLSDLAVEDFGQGPEILSAHGSNPNNLMLTRWAQRSGFTLLIGNTVQTSEPNSFDFTIAPPYTRPPHPFTVNGVMASAVQYVTSIEDENTYMDVYDWGDRIAIDVRSRKWMRALEIYIQEVGQSSLRHIGSVEPSFFINDAQFTYIILNKSDIPAHFKIHAAGCGRFTNWDIKEKVKPFLFSIGLIGFKYVLLNFLDIIFADLAYKYAPAVLAKLGKLERLIDAIDEHYTILETMSLDDALDYLLRHGYTIDTETFKGLYKLIAVIKNRDMRSLVDFATDFLYPLLKYAYTQAPEDFLRSPTGQKIALTVFGETAERALQILSGIFLAIDSGDAYFCTVHQFFWRRNPVLTATVDLR